MEFLGNLILADRRLGNDTDRNTIDGSDLAANQYPDQQPAAVVTATRSIRRWTPVRDRDRWQTPLAHMRRTATRDVEFGGKQIRKGDKVVMWYVSGNRDDEVIDNPNAYIIDRERPRQHVSFGFGNHRRVGNRLEGAAAAGDLGGDPAAFSTHRAAGGADPRRLVVHQGLRADMSKIRTRLTPRLER